MSETTALLNKEFLFLEDRRFVECHASTLVKLPNGDTLVAWFGGTREGHDDTAIWTARRNVAGWGSPVKVADRGSLPHWNPVLFAPKPGEVHLYYKVGRSIPKWRTQVLRSYDGGSSWSRPEDLVAGDRGGRGPVKNKIIVLSDGAWLAPGSAESGAWDAFVDVSRDGGRSWRRIWVPLDHDAFEGEGVIQPTLWESSPGTVHMLLRSTCGRVCRSDSTDYGSSWAPIYPTDLPNNNSGIDLAKLPNGRLALLHNPVSKNWGPRTPLIASVSNDNGQSWETLTVLEDESVPVDFAGYSPSEAGVVADGRAEFSYPAVVAHGAGIALTYTWKRKRIAYAEVSMA